MVTTDTLRGWLPAVRTTLSVIILPIAVLSLPLAAAQALDLSTAQTISWILALYAFPNTLSLALAAYYRQPLLVTGNMVVMIYLVSLGTQFSFPELVGATIVAGAAVLVISLLGLTPRLAAWIPAPIVYALLAGAVVPLVANVFTFLGEAPAMIGGAVLAYLWGRRRGGRFPAMLPALVVGFGIAALTGQVNPPPAGVSWPVAMVTMPVFSVPAILTASPVIVVLMTLQSNVPSLVCLKSEGYRPPERIIDAVSGIGTVVGSFFGPTAVSMSLPPIALIAGPEAGELALRHRAIYVSGLVVLVLFGLLAGVAAELPSIVPLSLVLALAGLALVGVLANALQQITAGPLLLGPLFTFVVALSDISFLGFGPFFWSLVVGMGVSLALEREAMRATFNS